MAFWVYQLFKTFFKEDSTVDDSHGPNGNDLVSSSWIKTCRFSIKNGVI